jgi:kynurenine 3-monooxygenase
MRNFTIVGGGLVGALQSVFLAQRGCRVDLFERRADIRTANIYQGRSINLAMSNRGWNALRKVGAEETIRKIAIPMYKRTMHDTQGNLTFQPYGKEGEAIFSVSRGELNKTLLQLADQYDTTTLHFNARCTNLDLDQKKIFFQNDASGEKFEHPYEHLIGTDGAFSAVRHRLMFNERFDYSQDYIDHGYKELHIEANEDGTHKMDPNTLHIWPREDFMLIALPNIDGSYTCTLFLSWEGKVSFNALKTERDVISFFQYYFPDVIPHLPDFVNQFMNHPTSALHTVRCYPWHYKDSVVLMGDAAHAVVPFYGQGMNAGFEDCFVFDQMLNDYETKFDQFFEAFGKSRKPNADAVAELALRNFIEMRDLTGDADFLLRKKIEAKFYLKHPDKWIPLYSMVTFSDLSYDYALKEGDRQNRIMKEIMARPDIHQNWEDPAIEQKIIELLKIY